MAKKHLALLVGIIFGALFVMKWVSVIRVWAEWGEARLDAVVFRAGQNMPVEDLPPVLMELLPSSFDYASWYAAQTGFEGDPAYFGAYSLLAVDDQLYAGFGTSRPAEADGALLASTDGSAMMASAVLSEQGFIDMLWQGNRLYIPGVDPCCGDDWTLGNTYTYTPTANSIRKNRNLPNILHTWGLWHDGNQRLYAATSGCHEDIADPNEITCADDYLGKLFYSDNGGTSWVELARGDSGEIGKYRTYDVIGLQGKLYVVWNDVYEHACGLAVSTDGGVNWSRIGALDHRIDCRARLGVFDNRVVALRSDRTGLYWIDALTQGSLFSFPHFRAKSWAYNGITQDGRFVYLITEDGRVMRSADLIQWDTLASSDRTLLAISYWPHKNWLVVSSRGNNPREAANLWKIDLATAEALVLPPHPEVNLSQQAGSVLLEWAASTGKYHIYRSASPFVPPLLPERIASTDDTFYLDENPCSPCYYTVRAEDAREVFSVPLRKMGDFQVLIPFVSR